MKAIDPFNSFYDFQFAMTEYQRQKHPASNGHLPSALKNLPS